MKTLTITISEKAASALEHAAAGGVCSAEEVASRLVESAYLDAWGDLDADDIAAIEEGLADIERGATMAHDQVVAAFKATYG